MVGTTQQEQYTNLRHQNYATARFIGFTCGSFSRIAHYLLGMTIELSYKQLCSTLLTTSDALSKNEIRLIEKSHDLIKLHQLCLDKGFLKDMTEYEMFLNYANIFYKTRYPSHAKEAQQKASQEFPFLATTINNYFPFDDFICHLDDEIFKATSNHKNSIIYSSIYHINNYLTKSIFHCNGFAYKRIDNYIKFLDNNNPINKDSLTLLNTDKESLLTRGTTGYSFTSIENANNLTYKNFKALLPTITMY